MNPNLGNWKSVLKQMAGAAFVGLLAGILVRNILHASIAVVVDVIVMAALADVICQLLQRPTALKDELAILLKVSGVVIIFLCIRMWVGAFFGMNTIHIINALTGEHHGEVMSGDWMLELTFLIPGAIIAWAVLYSSQAEKLKRRFLAVAIVAFLLTFISYRFPSIPESLGAVGSNLNRVTNKLSDIGLKGSTKEIVLARDIDVIYVPAGKKVVPLVDAYDGSNPDDAANLVKITDRFKAGQKLLKLAGARVVDNTKLCEVQIPGPDGKFIGGRVLLVDAADIVVKDDDAKKTKSASVGSTVGDFLGGIGGGKKVEAASSAGPAKRQPTSATITFDKNDPAKVIDSGLWVKVGDSVRYSGVQAPFQTDVGDKFTQDYTCLAYKAGVIRLCNGKGTLRIDVIPASE